MNYGVYALSKIEFILDDGICIVSPPHGVCVRCC